MWSNHRGVQASYRPSGLDWRRPELVSRATGHLLHASIDERGRATAVWYESEAIFVADRPREGGWRRDGNEPGTGFVCCWTGVPTAATDETGNLVVTWTDSNGYTFESEHSLWWRSRNGQWMEAGEGAGSYRDIAVRGGTATFAKGGQGIFTMTSRLGEDSTTWEQVWPGVNVSSPVIAENSHGDMILAALDDGDSGGAMNHGDPGQLVVLVKPVGERWRQLFVTDGPQEAGTPAVAIDDHGDVAVAYKNIGEQSLEVRVGSTDNPASGAPTTLSAKLEHPDGASLAFNTAGDLVATWYTGTTDGARPVHAARRTADGSWGAPVRIGTRDKGMPAVTAYPNGMFTTLFELNGAVKWTDHVADNLGPRTSMRAPRRDFTRSTRVPVRWVATDELARPHNTDVRVRSAGRAGRFGAWSMWKRRTTDTAARYPGEPGHTYCFSARSRDRVGNLGRWSPRRCTTTPIDDRAFSATGGWSLNRQRAAYRNTLTVTDDAGKVLRLERVRAKKLRLVAATCRGCGSIRVIHGGRNLGVVDLRTPRARNKVVIPIRSYDRIRGGRIALRAVSSGKPVRIDGLIASR